MKHVVIIPSLNPDKRLISLVDELVHKNEFKIIIVDDGSDAGFDDIFKKLNIYEDVIVLKHKRNLGKGASLKTALSYCLENFKEYSGVIAADCDGKYEASDIIKVSEELNTNPNCLILGVRSLNKENSLKRNYIGNKLLNSTFKVLYGLTIKDTQTGLRAISMKEIDWLAKIHGNHYDYEVNVLIQFKRRDIEIKQVPIKVKHIDNKSTHYRTYIDTVRIIGLLIFNICLYSAASIGSAVIDVGTFFISNTYIFSQMAIAERLFISTVISRTLSSLWDFTMNRKFFTISNKESHSQFKKQFYKYYLLWIFQMMTSYSLVFLFNSFIHINASIIKSVVDITLALLSYQLQLRFVFASDSASKPYGNLYYFCRGFLRIFNRKLTTIGEVPNEPVVFVGHHQNLQGAMNVMMWFETPVHLWMLNVFCEKDTAFKQYYGYTFTVRLGYPKPIAFVFSKVLSFFVPKLGRSIRGIPVSRNPFTVIDTTIKPSAEILNKNENVLLFADIDYKSEDDKVGRLYTGFVTIDKFYYEKNKKHVSFVPIKVNKRKRAIYIGQSSAIKDGENFSQGKKRVCSELVENYNSL
ncbi:MAG: glycosyltransferase family 2 protein [Oscillospiraceae bacterium]|nr:glycosyltransferase family 2 protein [Oscillospiraceae bacterium]